MSDVARRRTLRTLSVVVGVQWLGAGLGLPLLPLFLERRGGSSTTVGFVMSAFFVAGLATQFGVGHLADRFGRRRVLVASLLAYGLGAATYLLPIGAGWFTLSRAVQGAGAGAFEVASLSAVSALFPEVERGRAMSRIFAAQLLGTALGPLAGSVVTVSELGWAFLASGIASTAASVVALTVDLGDRYSSSAPLPRVQRTSQLTGALTAAVAVGLCVGVYESCWSLLMRHHGATTLEIRLSWTLFCLPFVALSGLGGWLADHANRKLIAIAGTLNAAVFLAIYPHLHSPVTMLLTGPLESIGASLSLPSTSSLLTQGADVRELGRRQGLFTTASTAALALSAAVAGALFAVHPGLPFTVVAVASAAFTMSLWWWWRRVTGSIQHQRNAAAPEGAAAAHQPGSTTRSRSGPTP